MISGLQCLVAVELPAAVGFGFIVTTTAIDCSAFPRLEGYLRFSTASGTHCREHLTVGPGATKTAGATALCFSGLTAGRTAARLISKALSRIEFLFASGEGKRGTTIRTLQRLVSKTHRMTSSLLKFWARVSVIQQQVQILGEFCRIWNNLDLGHLP